MVGRSDSSLQILGAAKSVQTCSVCWRWVESCWWPCQGHFLFFPLGPTPRQGNCIQVNVLSQPLQGCSLFPGHKKSLLRSSASCCCNSTGAIFDKVLARSWKSAPFSPFNFSKAQWWRGVVYSSDSNKRYSTSLWKMHTYFHEIYRYNIHVKTHSQMPS